MERAGAPLSEKPLEAGLLGCVCVCVEVGREGTAPGAACGGAAGN